MDDLFVLLQMPLTKLVYLTRKTISESSVVPHGNRVYYFSENFEVQIILGTVGVQEYHRVTFFTEK